MGLEELTIEELEAKSDDLTEVDLIALRQDERQGARDLADRITKERAEAASPVEREDYDPRLDPGPPRPEDEGDIDDTPLSSPEVDLETQRKDDSTVLATDRFNEEGKRIILGDSA